MGALPGDSWCVRLHAERHLLPAAGSFTTLKRMSMMIACALDEGRTRGGQAQHAFLYQCYRVCELACLEDGHELEFGWPLLGIDDPGGRARSGLAPAEAATLAAWHRDRQHLDQARGMGGGKGAGSEQPWAKGGGGPGGGRCGNKGAKGAEAAAGAAAKTS